ncbi:MAG: TPM domain-containing protein [Eubacterium sp.]|nr:TPM domain-containing protein [Eubacterium sp.]
MKRIISFIFAAIIILALPLNALADSPKYAIDGAGLMDESEVSELEEMLASLSEKYNFDIVALTVDSTEGKSPMDFADDYYDYNGYKDDGCLFLISMEERDWWISTKGYGITAITDYGIEVIEAEVVPFLSNGDYFEAFKKYAKTVEEFINEANSGEAFDVDNNYTNDDGYTYNSEDYNSGGFNYSAFIISLIVSLIIAAVVVSIVKGNYKPVRFRANAEDYLVDGSLRVTNQHDRFLFSNVSKTRIEHNSSSGGSSTHTSSSGSSHGGGGGKF